MVAVGLDLTCAGCGYNLRGLPADSRCPECGMGVGYSLDVCLRSTEDDGAYEHFDALVQALYARVATETAKTEESVRMVATATERPSAGDRLVAADVCRRLYAAAAEDHGDGAGDALAEAGLHTGAEVGRVVDALARAGLIVSRQCEGGWAEVGEIGQERVGDDKRPRLLADEGAGMGTGGASPGMEVLAYEQRSETTSMVWLLRFVGIWCIATGLAPIIDRAVIPLVYRRSVLQTLIAWQNAWPAASVLIGLALLTRWRVAWLGVPWLLLGGTIAAYAIQWAQSVPMDYTQILGSAWLLVVQWLILRAIRRRAEEQGALRPVRAGTASPVTGSGGNMQFMLRCVGWYYLGMGLSYLPQVPGLVMGLGRLDIRTLAGAITVGSPFFALATAGAGFYLVRRHRWAMGVLIAVPLAHSLFIKACIEFTLVRTMTATSSVSAASLALTLLTGLLSVLTHMALLRAVDRKAAKDKAYAGQ